MLPSTLSSLHRTAEASRPAADVAAWNVQAAVASVSYFYGYWFSHWRA
ncbi:hypothetical protein ACIPL1_18305 [Pseudomonas sp. NPDC090202]